MLKVGLTGNIASGKSIVQSYIEKKGIPVIDADWICHRLMDENEEVMEALEDILHPLVEEKIKQFFEEHEDEEIVVASVPLLFEENMQNLFDRTVLVCADKKVRLQRLMNRNGYPLEHALERINAQVSQEEKRNMADFIIENNNNLIELETQIEKTLERLWL